MDGEHKGNRMDRQTQWKSNGWVNIKGLNGRGYPDGMVGDVMECVIHYIEAHLVFER